jgi:antiphage defense system Thoeris ThsB-like protein
MYRQKRADTLVGSIERKYGIKLNARSGARLGNLLGDRGFASLSELLKAHRGRLDYHASPRRVFLSFHREDLRQVAGVRLMMKNERLALDISDEPNREPVGSERSSYIKRVLRDRIRRVDVVMCLIGDGTAWREWVDWELRTAIEEGRGVCGVRLKGSRGRAPEILKRIGAPVAPWDLPSMIAAIECAAARRS